MKQSERDIFDTIAYVLEWFSNPVETAFSEQLRVRCITTQNFVSEWQKELLVRARASHAQDLDPNGIDFDNTTICDWRSDGKRLPTELGLISSSLTQLLSTPACMAFHSVFGEAPNEVAINHITEDLNFIKKENLRQHSQTLSRMTVDNMKIKGLYTRGVSTPVSPGSEPPSGVLSAGGTHPQT